MSFMDGLLLTLLNTIGCLALPKLLSIILAAKTKTKTKTNSTAPLPTPITLQESPVEIPSFP